MTPGDGVAVWEADWQGGRLRHDPTDPRPGRVEFGDAGGLVLSWTLGALRIDGRTADLVALATRTEPDEIEWQWHAGPARITLRHTVDVTWQLRLVLTNETDRPCRVDEVALTAEPGAGRTGWAVRAGAEGSLLVLGERPDRVLPGFVLSQGEVRGEAGRLEHGPVELRPGGTHVVRWRGEPADDLTAIVGRLHEVLPEWPYVGPTGEASVDHPDLALLEERVDPGIELITGDDGTTQVAGAAGGSAALALVGARGRTEIELHLTRDLADAARWWCEQHAWPRGRQGIVIDDPAEAVVAQSVLGAHEGGSSRLEEWVDAVDGACARLAPGAGDGGVLTAILLAQQAIRTGEPESAERAGRALAGLDGHRGCGLATARVLAAAAILGVTGPVARPMPPPGSLEAELVSGRPLGPAWGRWAATFGYGVRGSSLAPADPVGDAHRLAVAAMAWELRPHPAAGWPYGPAEIIDRHRRRLIAEVTARPDAPTAAAVLAWLICAG